MLKKLQLQSIKKAKGRPMLQWAGKKPLDKIEYYPAQEKEIYGDKNSVLHVIINFKIAPFVFAQGDNTILSYRA